MSARAVAVVVCGWLLVGCSSTVPPTLAPSTSPTSAPTALTSLPTSAPAPTSSLGLTPTPEPTASGFTSVLPTPTSEPTFAESPSLSVTAEDISRHLDALMQIATDRGGIRAAGTAGYDVSADYVAEQLNSLGFVVERKPFDFTFFDEAAPVELAVGEQSWSGSEWLHSMLYGGGGNVSGVLQSVRVTPDGSVIGSGGCEAADWVDFVPGNIAVVVSGPCFRLDQVINAQNSGAVGLVSLYLSAGPNQVRRPTLSEPDVVTIPSIAAGGEPSAAILAALAAPTSAQLNVQVITRPATIDNVTAEWPGASVGVVMLGGHLDSVLDGPGINDNGSGTATLLSLAQSVALTRPRDTIRIAFWGAEEFGEFGSHAYVAGSGPSEIPRISAYLNLDMVASPNPARFVYGDAGSPPGSDELVQRLLDALSLAGTPGLTTDINGSSDHFPFAQAGVPVAGVFSGVAPLTGQEVSVFGGQIGMPADPCYHLSCDTSDNISLDSAVTLGNAVASVVQDLAYEP